MNRKLKFRCWHIGKLPGKMLYDEKPGDCLVWKSQGQEIDSIMQFTNLLDKNGKEIWEGDIVVVPNYYIWFDGEKSNYRGTVEWIYSQWQVVAHCINPDKAGISDGINEGLNDEGIEDGNVTKWEIIGNIYEHSHLLEVSK